MEKFKETVDISTILNIGDKVWIMYNNRPIQCTIIGIKITFSKGSFWFGIKSYEKIIQYELMYMGLKFAYDERMYESHFFSTKEKLIKSL